MRRLTLSPDVQALNPGLTHAPAAPRPPRAPRAPGAEVGGNRDSALAAAADRGWCLLESEDGRRYRFRSALGATTPWGTYDATLDYARRHNAPGVETHP